MKTQLFVVLLCLNFIWSVPAFKEAVKVGVIGGGVGGGALSYYLKKFAKQQVNVTAYESNNYIGGRLKNLKYDGAVIEVGGDAFADENTYLIDATKDAKIEMNPIATGNAQQNISLGIYDGKSFQTISNSWSTYGRELALEAQILRFKATLKLNYKLRELSGKTFDKFEDFLWYGGLSSFTSTSSRDFADSWFVGKYLEEIAWEPLTRVIYDQSLSIQAFAGIVSLLPAVSENYSAKKGNSYMVEKLFEYGGAEVRLNTRATTVTQQPDGRFQIASVKDGKSSTEIYDHVVLATPFEFANLEFKNMKVAQVQKRKYTFWDITIVIASSFNPKYFGVKSPSDVPDSILTPQNSTTPFIAITNQGTTDSGLNIFKVSSNKNISADIRSIFLGVEYVYQHRWAYTFPVLDPLPKGQAYQPITLASSDRGSVYYINGIESVATAMECSTISARNIAQKIARR